MWVFTAGCGEILSKATRDGGREGRRDRFKVERRGRAEKREREENREASPKALLESSLSQNGRSSQ